MSEGALVTIDNSVIDRLLGNAALTAKIPFLQSPPRANRRSCCDAGTIDYRAIKSWLAGVDTKTLGLIKQTLGAGKIRFYRPTRHNNKTVTVKHTK